MAAVTHRVSTPSTAQASTYVSDSFTPVASELLVIFAVVTGTVTNPATCTASANGLTFTQVETAVKATSADRLYCFIANQLVPGSPVAMTVTIDTGADAGTGADIFGAGVSGMTRVGAAAERQSGAASNGGIGTPAVTLPAAALTTNPVLAFVANGANPAAISPPASFTELADSGYATPTTGAEYASRDSGHTSATVTWGSASSTSHGELVVELDASVPVSAAPPRPPQFVRDLSQTARPSGW